MAPTSSSVGSSPPPAAAQGLLVEIEDQGAPTRRLLRISGELDLATAGLFLCAVDRAATDRHEVELDLSGLSFCDVVGATAIELAQQHLQARGRRLTLHGIDGPLHLLLAVEGLFGGLRRSAGVDGHQPSPVT